MFNTQLQIFRLLKDGEVSEYESKAYATVMAHIEPSGVTPVAPIDTNIGNPYNVNIRSQVKLGIKEGDRVVNINDDTEIYVIISSINEYKLRNGMAYEFVTYKPK